MDAAPSFYAKDRTAWRAWLQKNHNNETSVWLIFDKGPSRTLSYDDIVEEALCFGWIDSRPGKVSDTQTKLYISKRKPKSVWSKLNKERLIKLQTQGLVTKAGQDAIDIAKQNGSWDSLTHSDNQVIPDDMQKLFSKNKVAKENFNNFSQSTKRNILEWIYSAKRPETRAQRISKTVELAAQNIKVNQQRQQA